MKVLHINCNYIGTTLHQLMVEELDRFGIENEVFVPTYDRTIAVIKPNSNVYVSECFRKWDRLLFDYKQSKILKAIEEHYDVASFDLIHAYTLFTDGNAARILSEKYGVPFVVAVRNTDVNDFFSYMVHLRSRGIKTMLAAQKVYFLSPSYRETVFETYVPESAKEALRSKTEIVPNGIDRFWFANPDKKRDCSEISSRLKQKQLRLVYAGGIDRNKNITTTCEAIRLLEQQGWTVAFTVVGKVKSKKVYEQIQDKAHCLPSKPKKELIHIYRSADIFVMPSITESFGLVYVEAMTQGLPVIYSRGQGFDGQFEEGNVGYAVEARSAEDIAEKILRIADRYSEISNACYRSATKFQWSKIAERYQADYDRLCGSAAMGTAVTGKGDITDNA